MLFRRIPCWLFVIKYNDKPPPSIFASWGTKFFNFGLFSLFLTQNLIKISYLELITVCDNFFLLQIFSIAKKVLTGKKVLPTASCLRHIHLTSVSDTGLKVTEELHTNTLLNPLTYNEWTGLYYQRLILVFSLLSTNVKCWELQCRWMTACQYAKAI